MPNFEEALKSSLLGVNEKFRHADADLHEEVNGASMVIEKLTDGKIRLTLSRRKEDSEGVFYVLRIEPGNKYGEEVGGIKVSSSGYPLGVAARATDVTADENYLFCLKDRPAIGKYFAELASNPDSPLVKKLAFLLRCEATKE